MAVGTRGRKGVPLRDVASLGLPWPSQGSWDMENVQLLLAGLPRSRDRWLQAAESQHPPPRRPGLPSARGQLRRAAPTSPRGSKALASMLTFPKEGVSWRAEDPQIQGPVER